MRNWKDNVRFLLVRPTEGGNIGAAARAIKNMGFRNLGIVGSSEEINEEARRFAHNAEDVLDSASFYNAFGEAIKDASVVIGATRRRGRRRGVIVPVEAGARQVCALAQDNRIAFVFGREDRGLYNEEVEECGFMVTIPTGGEQPSLNLSHAVLIVAYELLKAGYALQSGCARGEPHTGGGRKCPVPSPVESEITPAGRVPLVAHEELTRFFGRVSSTLRLLDYMPRGDRDLDQKIMQNIKRFLSRGGLTKWELKMLNGVISQIEKKIRK
jgi:TrmH family RNA methyltransferase